MTEIARIGIKAADSIAAGILAEGGRMMVGRLSAGMPELLEKVAEKVFDMSEQATDGETKGSLLLLQGEVRQKIGTITGALRTALQAEFNKTVTPAQSSAEKARQPFDISALSLVDFEAMDESLVVTNLTSSLRNACGAELRQLNTRTARLLGARDFEEKDNPFGPEVVANAFKNVFSSIENAKSRLTLLQLLEKLLPDTLAAFYAELNGYFSSRGVEGDGKYSVKKSASPVGSGAAQGTSQQAGGDGNPAQSGAEGGEPGDLFGSLQQLIMMNMNRGGAAGMAPAPGGSFPSLMPGGGGVPFPQIMPPMATNELLQSLTFMQRGDLASLPVSADQLPVGFDAQQLAAGTANVLRSIRDAGLYNPTSQVDAITIDVVAMLFDYVFDDHDIPAAVRVLIGRLQIPVLKAAMLDKKFFSKKDNPARNLLDRLAQVSVALPADVGEDDPLYQRISVVVHDVIDNFEDDVGVFLRAAEQLDKYIAEEQSHAEEQSQSTADVLYRREIAEFAQIMAREEIVKRAGKVPVEIQDFLLKYWLEILAKAYETEGEASEAWKDGLQVVEDLAWSIEPKIRQEDRLRLVRTLPKMLKQLEQAMRDKSASDGEVKAFSAKLVELHIAALKGQQTQEKPAEEAAPEPAVPVEIVPASEVVAAKEQDLAAADESAPAIIPAPLPEAAQPVDDGVIETMKWTLPTKDLTAEDEFDQMAKQLKKGCWVEFGLGDGGTLRSKLTWISPMKGVMLFADRDGANAVKISPKSLAKRFRAGTASLIGDASLVERAVTNVMGQLMKNGPEGMPQPA